VDTEAVTRFLFARSEEGLQAYFAKGNINKAAWELHLRNSAVNNKFPYRGVIEVVSGEGGGVVGDSDDSSLKLITARVPPESPLLALCYTGQGCQWEGMAKELWVGDDVHSKLFRSTIESATADLPVDIDELFSVGEKWLSKQWSGFGITLVQVGLTAVLTAAGVVPDYIFGHSVGEVACGYADGCTSAKEAARIAFVRCQLSDRITASGLMLAVGLDYDSALALLEPYRDTVIACHNDSNGVTLSGSAEEVMEIATALEAKGVFAKVVPTDGIAYHSKFFKEHSSTIQEILEEVVTDPPMPRTARWLSTSCPDCRSGRDHKCSLYADAAYHTRNITGQVNFAPIVISLPKGTVIVEVGPHGLLKSSIKRCLAADEESPSVLLTAMRKNHSGVNTLSSLLDSLWLEGILFNFPAVRHMVPVRHRVNMEWDHDNDWRVPAFEDFSGNAGSSKSVMKVSFDLAGKDAFLMDHVIDGRCLLPATAHVYCAWVAFGTDEIHFVDVKILGAILLDGESVTLSVSIDGDHWEIFHEGLLVSRGTMAAEYQIPSLVEAEVDAETGESLEQELGAAGAGVGGSGGRGGWVDKDSVYARFARFGYEYGEQFRVIQQRSLDARRVFLGPACHWIAYLDNVLQAFLHSPSGLCLPTAIGTVSI
jgi:fatty acid synthase